MTHGERMMSQERFNEYADRMNVTEEEARQLYDAGTTYIDSSWSRTINRYLTEGKVGEQLPDDFLNEASREAVRILDKVIEKNVAPTSIRAVRYVSDYWLTEGGREIKEGDTIHEYRFTSTSAVSGKSNGIIRRREVKLEITIPRGAHCFISKNSDESEIILPRNSDFKVVSRRTEDGKTVIRLRYLSKR